MIEQALIKTLGFGSNKRDYMRKPQEWKEDTGQPWVSTFIENHPVIVDREDLPLVRKYRWYFKSGYAITSIAYKRVRMHHLIVGKPEGKLEVDHINQDKLDNRRENLRIVSRQVNQKNVKGKGYRDRGTHWEAYIQNDRKYIHLGVFATEEEAKAAREAAKTKYHGISALAEEESSKA